MFITVFTPPDLPLKLTVTNRPKASQACPHAAHMTFHGLPPTPSAAFRQVELVPDSTDAEEGGVDGWGAGGAVVGDD